MCSVAPLSNNVANVSSNNPDANPNDNADVHTHVIEAQTQIEIVKSAQPATVAPGGSIAYRIIVQLDRRFRAASSSRTSSRPKSWRR